MSAFGMPRTGPSRWTILAMSDHSNKGSFPETKLVANYSASTYSWIRRQTKNIARPIIPPSPAFACPEGWPKSGMTKKPSKHPDKNHTTNLPPSRSRVGLPSVLKATFGESYGFVVFISEAAD